MKHSAKVMAFGMALTTAMVPQALAQIHHPANVGPPPLMSPAQTQPQQKMQAPKQQNNDSRARGAAAGVAIRAAMTGNAAAGAVVGSFASRAEEPAEGVSNNPTNRRAL